MALECSAALPIIATTIMPTKVSVMPKVARHALDCADQKFGKQRHESSSDQQNDDRLAARPILAFFLHFAFGPLKEMSVRLERETEHAKVGDKKHQGDRQRKPLLHYWTPATWAKVCGHMEHRRND